MKKLICLFLCLVLVCGTACGLLAAGIGQSREAVSMEFTPVFGDAEYLSGAEVDFNVMFGKHLLWQNRWSPEMGERAESGFSYSLLGRQPEESVEYPGLQLRVSPAENLGGYAGKRENDLDRAFRERFDSVKPGERKSFELRIADYLEFYPLSGRLQLPGLTMNYFDSFNEQEVQFITKLEEFFRIPVLPDEVLEIEVDRSSDGATTGIGYGSKEEYDSYYMETVGFVAQDACYFTFSPKTAKGANVDTSHIPGGYGIYRLPYAIRDGETTVDPSDCSLYFPLDPTYDIYEMFCVEDRIYLVVTEEEEVVLRELELSTGRELSRLVIARNVQIYDLQRFEGFFVADTSDDRMTVVTLGEIPRVELSVDAKHTELHGFNYGSRETMAWDGERLLIANTLPLQEDWVRGTGFRLVVYDAGGLRYAGIYQSSLLSPGDGGNWSEMCRPDEYGPALSVRWR